MTALGVIHSHQTLGFEIRQAISRYPADWGEQLTSAPVGHFMGMLGALLSPVLRGEPINLADVWDPARVLALMADEGLCVGGGATYYMTSLLDHPDFTSAHLAAMKYAGLGGAPVPAAVAERLTAHGITVYRSYGSTEHPSVTGSHHTDPERKRLWRAPSTGGASTAEVAGGDPRRRRLPADGQRQGAEVHAPQRHCDTP